ncbi:hypothetical protein AAC387_Pa05g0222 [Persea americana]
MIIDTTKVQAINSFSKLESLKEVIDLSWLFDPIFTHVSGIIIGALVIVCLERKIYARMQQHIKHEHATPLGILQALADGTKLLLKEDLFPFGGDICLVNIGPFATAISI